MSVIPLWLVFCCYVFAYWEKNEANILVSLELLIFFFFFFQKTIFRILIYLLVCVSIVCKSEGIKKLYFFWELINIVLTKHLYSKQCYLSNLLSWSWLSTYWSTSIVWVGDNWMGWFCSTCHHLCSRGNISLPSNG